MAHLSRIRSSRKQPLSPKRQRELRILAENDMMTLAHFKGWKDQNDLTDASFMSDEHMLRCPCGQNKKATIADAVHLNWIVSTKNRTITKVRCPSCGKTDLRKLERDVSTFMKNRSN